MRIVVTGCARSATMYAAELLRTAGVDCRHEHLPLQAGDVYQLPGDITGESSCYVAPFLPLPATVVHLVRPPLDTIGSLAGRGMLDGTNPAWAAFTRAHTPEVFDHPPGPMRAAAYWLAWNRLVEPHAHLTWTTPTLSARDVLKLAHVAALGIDEQQAQRALGRVSPRINSAEFIDVALADLGGLADPVARMAKRYGVPLTHTPTQPNGVTMADIAPAESFRNKQTGFVVAANPGTPEYKQMVGRPGTFERVPDEPAKPKRTRKQPAPDAPVEGPIADSGGEQE